MGKYPPRTHCELCGRKLEKVETNSRNVAICKICLKKNMLGLMLSKETGVWN